MHISGAPPRIATFPANLWSQNQEAFEEYLGATLIERNAKSISLTPIGQEVAEKARQIVSQVDALLTSTRKPRGPLAGAFNLGVIPTLAPYFLPWFIPLAKSHYPRLQLVVHEDLTEHLLDCAVIKSMPLCWRCR